MLIERLRADPAPVAEQRATEASSAFGTAPMPTDPMVPSTPLPSPADPPSLPALPTPSTPSAPPTPPKRSDPFGVGPAQPGSGPSPSVAFVSEAVDVGCEKLVSCNIVPGLSAPMCQSMVKDLGVAEAEDKIARGDCSVNRRAANQCLDRIKRLDCSAISADVSRLSSLITGPLVVCAEAINCR